MFGSTSPYKDATGGRVSENEVFDGEDDDDIKGCQYGKVESTLTSILNWVIINGIIAYLPIPRSSETISFLFFGGGGLRSHVNDDFEWNSSLTQAHFFFQK